MSCSNFCTKMEQHGLVEPHVQDGATTKKKRPIMFGTNASFDVASDDELQALLGIGGV